MKEYLIIVLSFAFVSSVLLVITSFKQKEKLFRVLKPLSSIGFVLLAFLILYDSGPLMRFYGFCIVCGHVFSAAGDVALLGKSMISFIMGVIFFAVAHCLYFTGLSFHQYFTAPLPFAIITSFGVGFFIYRYIRSGLGRLRVPVVIYIVLVAAMFSQALSVPFTGKFTPVQSIFIITGAAFFYASDCILAVVEFVGPFKGHRTSLALYYAGQIFLALSILRI